MLVEWGEKAPVILISLPAGAQERLAVRTPEVQQDGGLSPLLVELSDVRPLSSLVRKGWTKILLRTARNKSSGPLLCPIILETP